MLGMVLGFLGSAFAPAMGVGSLLAGSIGMGLGTAIEQKDIGAGLRAGLGSFAGGKLLGGLMGSTAGGAAANAPTAANLAQAQAAGLPAAAAMAPPMRPETAAAFGSGGTGGLLSRGMEFAQSPTGIGALLGGTLATPMPTVDLPKSSYSGSADVEMRPIPRQAQFPGANYVPGASGEFDYGVSTPFSYTDVTNYRDRGVLPYAEGGKTEIEVDDETGEMEVESEAKRPVAGNEKTEIVDAIKAVKGMHPQPEIALGKFLAKYGEDALRDLVDSVQSGEFDETLSRFERGEKGMVRGPGDGSGKDDKVPATIDGEQDVLLTEGEFVMRKDATDALEKMYGGGFLSAVNKAGKQAPEVLKKKVAA
jgi:hypothetical protein